MIVDIVDKYCTNDNNPIKNLRLKEHVRNKSRDVMIPTAVSATEGMPSTSGTPARGWLFAKAGKKAMSERL